MPVKEVGGRLCVSIHAVASWLASDQDAEPGNVSSTLPARKQTVSLAPARKSQNIGKMIALLMMQQRAMMELVSCLESELLTMATKANVDTKGSANQVTAKAKSL